VRLDGWASAFTNIGIEGRDKRLSHTFQGSCLAYEQIAWLWAKNGLAAKAIEAPSAEAFREGYEINIQDEGKYDDLKEEVEDKLEELSVNEKIERAWQFKRAYGAGLILLGTDDPGGLDEKLDPTKVRSLEYLEVFEPIEIVPEDLYTGLRNHGRPEFYRINTNAALDFKQGRGKTRRDLTKSGGLIHESRLIVFDGIQTSNYMQSTNMISPYYGGSVVDRFIDALRDCGVGYEAAGILPIDVSQPVITIEGLMNMVAKNEEKFRARMAAFELSRSNARIIALGEKEKYERQTTNLGGIPELLDRLSIKLSADIDIPLSVLFGYSPSSLGQPGEVELKLWYNRVRAIQSRDLSPVLKMIVKMIMRSLRQRKIPKKFGIDWHELERMTLTERIEAELNMARRDSMDIKSGMASPDELRKTRYKGGYSFKTNINESKKAPGFLAPLPAGVVPGTSVTGAPGAPAAAAGPAAHSVRTYARRNPSAPAGGQAAPKQGGDKAPGSRSDEADFDVVAEADAARAALERANQESADPAVIQFLEAWLHECELDVLESMRGDADGGEQHVTYAGMQVCIESPKGSTRTWVDTDGTPGSTTMKYDYGYAVGTAGTDGDSVDIYLGPNEDAQWIYVVHQMSKATAFATHDEDKVMLGWSSPDEAKRAYLQQYDDPRFFGGMSMMSLDDFRLKLFARPGEKVTHADEAA
jgi:phage-related protein (TIGR01555 family)